MLAAWLNQSRLSKQKLDRRLSEREVIIEELTGSGKDLECELHVR